MDLLNILYPNSTRADSVMNSEESLESLEKFLLEMRQIRQDINDIDRASAARIKRKTSSNKYSTAIPSSTGTTAPYSPMRFMDPTFLSYKFDALKHNENPIEKARTKFESLAEENEELRALRATLDDVVAENMRLRKKKNKRSDSTNLLQIPRGDSQQEKQDRYQQIPDDEIASLSAQLTKLKAQNQQNQIVRTTAKTPKYDHLSTDAYVHGNKPNIEPVDPLKSFQSTSMLEPFSFTPQTTANQEQNMLNHSSSFLPVNSWNINSGNYDQGIYKSNDHQGQEKRSELESGVNVSALLATLNFSYE